MGIPHLISTLEPYAQHAVLQNVDVVVDGPGLAHHVLHVCRVNGVDHPSYRLLGKTVVAWLDQLASQNTTVKAIYFDGYLPTTKRPVRMERAVKSMSQLTWFYSNNGRGCPRNYAVEPSKTGPVDAFRHGRPENKPFEAPSFLVPAVIEALRRSKTYKSLTHVVPGEADGYCAKAASETGGIVITSDSDLLVHDLGDGGVALLRDIYRDDKGIVRAALYHPRQIFQKLGLSGNSDICRFAYERWSSAHATTALLIRACSEPVADAQRYKDFCLQYRDEERAHIPELASGTRLVLDGFDPRWSEVVLQLSQPGLPEDHSRTFQMFLPILADSPEKGTAWENSRYIRQLTYSIARRVLPGAGGSIHEYRRVQSQDQNGRQVTILPPSSIHSETEELADVLQRLSTVLAGRQKSLFWPFAYIILDVRGAAADGRSSFVFEMLQRRKWPSESAAAFAWPCMHLVAHLQAVYYSLRMLQQLIRAGPVDARKVAGTYFAKLAQSLETLPPLEDSPNANSSVRFLSTTSVGDMDRVLSHFIEIPRPEAEVKKANKGPKKKKVARDEAPKAAKSTAAGNMFGLLPVE